MALHNSNFYKRVVEPIYHIIVAGKVAYSLIISLFVFVGLGSWWFLDLSINKVYTFFQSGKWLGTSFQVILSPWFLAVVFLIGFCALLFVLLKRVQYFKRLKSATKRLYFAADNYKELYMLLAWFEIKTEEVDAELSYRFRDALHRILKDINHIFACYTGDRVHVSVKTFCHDSDGNKTKDLETFLRDRENDWRRRWDTDQDTPSIHYNDHSPFSDILGNGHSKSFVSNNLLYLHRRGLYRNSNENWSENYNAALICPLTRERDRKKVNFDTVEGFLCIDNLKGGFDDAVVVHLARMFARVFYDIVLDTKSVPVDVKLKEDDHV